MKRILLSTLAVGLLAGAGFLARKGYSGWQQDHWIAQANQFLSRSDKTNALLCLQRVLQVNRSNIKACRLFAQMAEEAHSQNALFWRRRVIELEPLVDQDRIELAKTALFLGDLASAGEALGALDQRSRTTAEYHKLSGSLAFALNRYAEAETHFIEASRLEPTNPVSRLNLATVRLVVDNGSKIAAARASLEELRSDPNVGNEALRQLIQDSLRNSLPHRAIPYANALTHDPNCRFSDRLLYLDVLRQAGDERYAASLAGVEQAAATDASKTYPLAGWLAANLGPDVALDWIHSVSPLISTNLPVAVVVAECCTRTRNWTKLAEMLNHQNWKETDYLRHAFLSQAFLSQGQALEASVEWRMALSAASTRLEALNELVRRTVAWKRNQQLDEILWVIVDKFPDEKGAFLLLYDRLFQDGNTPALHNLLTKIFKIIPSNRELKNNLAIVSLLEDPRQTEGHQLAREIFTEEPQNPFVVSTYAYSLFCQGRKDEALRLMEGLTAGDLEEPGVAAYYSIFLADAGQRSKAKHFLERAQLAKLLPEEKQLLITAVSECN